MTSSRPASVKRAAVMLVWFCAGCTTASASTQVRAQPSSGAQVRAQPGLAAQARAPARSAARGDSDSDGIPNDRDQCVFEAEDLDGFEDEDGCPERDNDCDGVADVLDLCANDAEDHDDFEDEDGCPEPDNDRDRVVDRCDRCPNDPETYNGCADLDGCPDHSVCFVNVDPVVIRDTVSFVRNQSRMTSEGRATLANVVAALQRQQAIQRIVVVGHSANGERAALALARANAARAEITRAGARSATLTVRGVADERSVQEGMSSVSGPYVELVVLMYSNRLQFQWEGGRYIPAESLDTSSDACAEPAVQCAPEQPSSPRPRGCR